MKIAATISDATLLIHAGADVEKTTYIIEVPDDSIPPGLRKYFEDKPRLKNNYSTISLSLVWEPAPAAATD